MVYLDYKQFIEKLTTTSSGREYLELIEQALNSRDKGKQRGYELHHIHPRALGGLNIKDNIVKLTVFEHCKAHMLLARALPCPETLRPVKAMSNMHSLSDLEKISLDEIYKWSKCRQEIRDLESKERKGTKFVISSSGELLRIKQEDLQSYIDLGYRVARRKMMNKGLEEIMVLEDRVQEMREQGYELGHSKSWKESVKGKHIGNYLSEETKKKISKVKKGTRFSEEHRKALSESHRGKMRTEESKIKQSDSLKGRILGPRSEETKQKISEKLKGNVPHNVGKISVWKDGKRKYIGVSEIELYPEYYKTKAESLVKTKNT